MICELLHITTNTIYKTNQEVVKDSELYNQFQESEDPVQLGFELVEHIDNRKKSFFEEVDLNWHTYTDYKQARTALQNELTIRGGFENLNNKEKFIAVKWHIVNPSNQTDYFDSIESILDNNNWYNSNSIEARQKRFNWIEAFAYAVIPYPTRIQTMQVIEGYKLKDTYIKYGIEGTESINVEGFQDPEGLFDYVRATPGTSFEQIGLAAQDFTPLHNYTKQQVIDKIMDVLINGNY